MKTIFRYRIFRQKFSLVATCSVLVVVLLCLLTYSYSTSGWVLQSQTEALSVFSESELRRYAIERLIDVQMNRIYADREIMRDLWALLGSRSMSGYLDKRKTNSLATRNLIRSFPEEIHENLFRLDGNLTQVALQYDEWIIRLGYGDSAVQYDFHKTGDEAALQHDDEIVFWRTVYDSSQDLVQVGKIGFYYQRSAAFRDIDSDSFRFVGVVDAENDMLMMLKGDEQDVQLLRSYLKVEEQGKLLYDGFGNRLFFFAQDSELAGYRMVACVDDRTMLSKWWGDLLFTLALFFVLAAVFLIFYSYSLRHDARFLDRILYVVNAVRHGVFPTPEVRRKRVSNEYGIIAAELDDMSRELHRYITTEYELKLKQRETDMRALQQQINPHFLYNTLESIRALALMNRGRDAAEAIANLGALYRDIVKKQDIITMADELNLLEKYLKVMGIKYSDQFFYQFEIAPEVLTVPTIKFWMQPLAENFFLHGFNGELGYNLIIISGSSCPEGYRIAIIDNGATLSPRRLEELNQQMQEREGEVTSDNIGMSNVYTRLKYFYGDDFAMCITNNKPGGIRVIVTIPKQTAED